MLKLWSLKPGDRVRTHDGAVAEVVAETEDGHWVRIRYIECADEPSLVGTEDLAHESELEDGVERERAVGR